MGKNKLLLPVKGKAMLHWVLDALVATPLSPIFVVVGWEKELIQSRCSQYGDVISVVENPFYRKGRSSSIQAGLAVLPPDARGVLIMPGDVPFIAPSLIKTLISVFWKKHAIIFPLVDSKKGHPIIFPSEAFFLLWELKGEDTLNDYLLHHPETTHPVPWDEEGPIIDIDTPEDYRNYHSVSHPKIQ